MLVGLGCSDRSSALVDKFTGKMSLSIRSSYSRVSILLDVTVGDEDELEEDLNNDSHVFKVYFRSKDFSHEFHDGFLHVCGSSER